MKKHINVVLLILCIVVIIINGILYSTSNRNMIYDSRPADKEISTNNNKIFQLLLNNDSILSNDFDKMKIKYDSILKKIN